jgi:hypothetical protein
MAMLLMHNCLRVSTEYWTELNILKVSIRIGNDASVDHGPESPSTHTVTSHTQAKHFGKSSSANTDALGFIVSACSESRCGAGTLAGEGRGPWGARACVREEGGRDGLVAGWIAVPGAGAGAGWGRGGGREARPAEWTQRSISRGQRRPERGAEPRLLTAAVRWREVSSRSGRCRAAVKEGEGEGRCGGGGLGRLVGWGLLHTPCPLLFSQHLRSPAARLADFR